MSSTAAKVATVTGLAAVLASAMAWLNAAEVKASVGATPPGYSKEVIKLLAAIAEGTGKTVEEIAELLSKLDGPLVQGFPVNATAIHSFSVTCAVVGQPYQVPEMVAIDGFKITVKAWPTNGAAAYIYVGSTASECTNVNSCYPLIRNEAYPVGLDNTKGLWVSTNVAGSRVIFSTEQRR